MSNRNDNHDDKPWEKKFEDGKDENGLYSRRASKRKDKLNSRLPLVLLLVFCFVVVATIALYFISLKTAAQPTNDDGGNIEVVTSSSSKSSFKNTRSQAQPKKRRSLQARRLKVLHRRNLQANQNLHLPFQKSRVLPVKAKGHNT